MSEMRVVGVRVELPANQPILLLREADGDRYLPIWIGSVEATAIALEQQGVKPARPLTHDLLRDVLDRVSVPAERCTDDAPDCRVQHLGAQPLEQVLAVPMARPQVRIEQLVWRHGGCGVYHGKEGR